MKIVPNANGAYGVQLAGVTSLEDPIISITPMTVDSGKHAYATQQLVAGLREGLQLHGVVLVVTIAGVRIFKPAASKGAHKSWNDVFCDSAAVVRAIDRGTALLGLFGDGYARTFSIPGLKEIAAVKIDDALDIRRLTEAIVTPTGDIFGWVGPSELAVLNAWGSGQDMSISQDLLFNPQVRIPPRPTISNIQWISGTQYTTPSDMDILIGGPDRPPSKRMLEQMRSDAAQDREGNSTPVSRAAATTDQEGYWAYMQRQVTERTARLNVMGDTMDNLEEQSGKWAEDVGKFVSQQKKKAVMGSKFLLFSQII
jgi:syntaxin-binding protein 5